MTILHSPDDDLISAYIDGVGEEADAAHIETCPVCQARVAEMRGVSAKVGGRMPVPDPAHRDRAIAAALAAGAGKARRRLTVAAGRLRHPLVPLLVLLALLTLLATFVFGRSPSDDVDRRADDEVLTTDIGAVDDPASLTDRLERGLESARARAATGGSDDSPVADLDDFPCQAEARTAAGGPASGPVLAALLEWQGQPAVVHVYEREPGATRQAYVLAADRCVLLARRTF